MNTQINIHRVTGISAERKSSDGHHWVDLTIKTEQGSYLVTLFDNQRLKWPEMLIDEEAEMLEDLAEMEEERRRLGQ